MMYAQCRELAIVPKESRRTLSAEHLIFSHEDVAMAVDEGSFTDDPGTRNTLISCSLQRVMSLLG